jgi:poly-gamma-glutamate synthesis protein (capsule biosynthesis protein)
MMTLSIAFVGDIMLGRDLNMSEKFYSGERITHSFQSQLEKENKWVIYGNTLPVFAESDLVIGNLETTITDVTYKEEKEFNFRLSPLHMDAIKLHRNQYLNLANNHILDYGPRGLKDTILHLDKMGIYHSGAGYNLAEASKPVVFQVKGWKIGIIGLSDHYSNWKADRRRSGINLLDYNNYDELLEDVKRLKETVDIVILSIHWGGNYERHVSKEHRIFAEKAIKSGVDIIHGHSSHHVKYIDNTKKYVVMYGMGDFIDDYAISSEYRNDLGMIVKVFINHNKEMDTKIFPTIISNQQVRLAHGKDAEEVRRRINEM